jgi:hypothetical protein
MIGQAKRDAIRREHRPLDDGRCAVRLEAYPCDAVELLNDLEAVEADARTEFERFRAQRNDELLALTARNAELEAKILRAVRDLS